MAYFEWAEDMEIDGGGPIDQDHQLLVKQVNELHTATSRGEGRVMVASLLQRTIASTRDHLRREEELMAQKGFPDLEKHKIGHDHFLESLYSLQKQLDSGGITVAAQLSAVLRDWLSLHIRRSDKKLRKFEQNLQRDQQRQALQTHLQQRLGSVARQGPRSS